MIYLLWFDGILHIELCNEELNIPSINGSFVSPA